MDPARNTVDAPAPDSALAGAVSAPPSTAVPSAPTSGLRGAAQLQAGTIDTQTSATPADTGLPSATSAALSPTAGENTTGETLIPSAASTDAPASSSRATTPVLGAMAAHIDADAPHANVLASSHSAAEEDTGDVVGDDATSAAERYWIQCHVTEEQLEAMATDRKSVV